MPRRIVASLGLATLVAAAGLSVQGTLGPTPAQALEDGLDPLAVTISSMSPAVLPQRGPIRISGTVTNRDTVTWTTINVYSFFSSTPMTTPEELASAAELPQDTTVGSRIADPESSATIEEIAPGDTLPFSFSVPRSQIPVTESGVYWFGVDALGQGPEGRDVAADGRARTFLSSVGPRAEPVTGAVVLPVRRALTYDDDGSLDGLDAWARDLSSGGRLRAIVDFGASAESRALTWLVDPALIDAVGRLAAGNPARSLAPTVVLPGDEGAGGDGQDPAPEPGGAGSASSSSASASSPSAAPVEPDRLTLEVQALATSWLARLGDALPGHQVLALPYGDLDVAGAADHRRRTYASARARSGPTLPAYDVPTDPAVASPSGYLDAAGIALADAGDTVLLTDQMFTGAEPAPGDATPEVPLEVPTVATDGVRTLVVTSSAAATGVGPGDPRSPLALRQQLLAQAAVRTLADDPQALVVMLPSDWDPVTSTGFFSGLDVSWLDLSSVAEVVADEPPAAAPVDTAALFYPRFQDRLQIDAAGFGAAEDLARAGDQLQDVLAVNDQVGRTVRDQALTSVSYGARSRPLVARLGATAGTRWVRDRLDAVRVETPPSFTMTGTSGPFSATVVNDLDQPVVVTLAAQVDSRISVEPGPPLEVPAGGQVQVLITAVAPEGGVHTVEIGLVDSDGVPLGGSDELTVRALAVSNVIWLFLGAAGALLFGAIAFRLVKRVRAARGAARSAAKQPGQPGSAASAAS